MDKLQAIPMLSLIVHLAEGQAWEPSHECASTLLWTLATTETPANVLTFSHGRMHITSFYLSRASLHTVPDARYVQSQPRRQTATLLISDRSANYTLPSALDAALACTSVLRAGRRAWQVT
jgi:hypothetical protein